MERRAGSAARPGGPVRGARGAAHTGGAVPLRWGAGCRGERASLGRGELILRSRGPICLYFKAVPIFLIIKGFLLLAPPKFINGRTI